MMETSLISSLFYISNSVKWRMPPIAMATGYSLVLMVSNRFPVTRCVTQGTLVTEVIHVSAQVTSNTCGAHLGGVLVTFPPRVVGLAPLVGTRGRTMIGGCWKAVIKSRLVHSVRPRHTVFWTKECTRTSVLVQFKHHYFFTPFSPFHWLLFVADFVYFSPVVSTLYEHFIISFEGKGLEFHKYYLD